MNRQHVQLAAAALSGTTLGKLFTVFPSPSSIIWCLAIHWLGRVCLFVCLLGV